MADTRNLSHKVAIVGAAETDVVGKLPTHSTLQLHAESAFNPPFNVVVCGLDTVPPN